MNTQLGHGRSIVSCAWAPFALGGGGIEGRAAELLNCGASELWLALGASLVVGSVFSRFAKNLVPKFSLPNGRHQDHRISGAKAIRQKPTVQGDDDRAKLVQRFLDQGRTAILLRPQIARTLDTEHFAVIQQLFQEETAFVSSGEVVLSDWSFEESDPSPNHTPKHRVEVSAFYLDRFTITNRQYKEFVTDGGYGQQSVWDASIWPRVNEFVDRSGMPGPRFWKDGSFGQGKDDLPVVGVSWYEADAFARWAGRRLPTDAEWVKAAICPHASLGQDTVPKKFPWGDSFDPQRANLWISSSGTPAEVSAFQPAGTKEIAQLIGNVWEWTACDAKITSYGREVTFELPLKTLRGGAFDTYFENQATCQLQSGDSPLARRRNVGFRCGISATDVIEFGGQA